MRFDNIGESSVDFVVSFNIKDTDTNKSETFYLPVYVNVSENHAELYSTMLDFGILYANSQISYKLSIRAKSLSKSPISVGYPFVPINSQLEYDFTKLISTDGIINMQTSNLLGNVILKTHGISEGEYTGKIIF